MDEVINYVMDTPGNTNPNVLRGMLENSSGDSRFVVTLTPTAQDFSGVMDKTPQEITAAYNAGKEIRVTVPELGGLTGICTEFSPNSGTISLWCNFTASFSELGGDVLIVVITSHTTSTYSTKIFSLTPLSG